MCLGGSPSVSAIPTPGASPQQGNLEQTLMDEERRKRAAASNTILTSPLGAKMPQMQPKSLLGA